ncbi:hypothetical protein [Rhodoblastus sp.]|uniref:hypothetical protein n=1 Tax=Rhodoblastus sp. TaxID=1962975 RepID=UPI003F9AE729
MACKKLNPASLAAGRALENVFCLAANNPEITQDASKIQEIRAAFIARKCRISRDIAETIALLAFGEPA